MPKTAKELGALAVSRLQHPGGAVARPVALAVGGVAGLMLQITPMGARSWLLRTMVGGRRKEIGLGAFPEVSLKEAKERAKAEKERIRCGIDPVQQRKIDKANLVASQKRGLTFNRAVDLYLESKLEAFRNEKHKQQWKSTLHVYARPLIGDKLVADIGVQDILSVLEPIWTTKTETASRLRGRIESILAWANVKGYRSGDNPARWKGNLKETLPAPSKVADIGHHPAIQIKEASAWFAALCKREGASARALEFLALTAARSGEVRGAKWDEIDFDSKVWVTQRRGTQGYDGKFFKAKTKLSIVLSTLSLAHMGTDINGVSI